MGSNHSDQASNWGLSAYQVQAESFIFYCPFLCDLVCEVCAGWLARVKEVSE
jgi:hypothetical protein